MKDKDTIYRQDAIEAMAEELLIFPIGLTEAYDVAENALSGLPSAEPQKKGEWLLVDAGYYDYVKCSQCGETLDWEKNFCPNCGADMREGEEE